LVELDEKDPNHSRYFVGRAPHAERYSDTAPR
jgi:hypothetical protein